LQKRGTKGAQPPYSKNEVGKKESGNGGCGSLSWNTKKKKNKKAKPVSALSNCFLEGARKCFKGSRKVVSAWEKFPGRGPLKERTSWVRSKRTEGLEVKDKGEGQKTKPYRAWSTHGFKWGGRDTIRLIHKTRGNSRRLKKGKRGNKKG